MHKTFSIAFVFVFLSFAMISSARAQNCDTVYEMIAELRQPPLGSFNLWDTVYGKIETREVFKGAVNSVATRDVVVIAEVSKNSASSKSIMLMEVDRRGRPIWEKPAEVEGLVSVEQMITHGGNYIVLANVERKGSTLVWIGFFDEKGTLFQEKTLDRKGYQIAPTSMTISNDKKDLIVTAYAKPSNLSNPGSTMVYWLNYKTKKVVRDRTFAFGTENRVNMIKATEASDGYLITGYIRTEDGRMAGWIARLDNEGGLVWQRPLARGLGGRFFDIAEFAEGAYLVATGEAFAADDTRKRAAWVLAIDSGGKDIAWQRYYRENHSMRAAAVLTQEDGQISVLIDAKESDVEEDKDYTRLLTLNPRGIVLNNLTFYNAEGSGAFGLMNGLNDERVIYGFTDVNFDVEKEDPQNQGAYLTEVVKSRQGWIVAAENNDAYDDPCRKDFSFIP